MVGMLSSWSVPQIMTTNRGLMIVNTPDVIKSRVQLRAEPPVGNPVRYIAHEFKSIIAESGL